MMYAVPQTLRNYKKRYVKLARVAPGHSGKAQVTAYRIITLRRELPLAHLPTSCKITRDNRQRSDTYQFHASNVYNGLIGTVSPQSTKPIQP